MGRLGKILLIDDSEAINDMNAYFFKKYRPELEVVTAKNGKEALAMIENPDVHVLPDLVLLDIKMPVFDGFEFLEYLNSVEFNFHDKLKVVLLTTSMNPQDTNRIKKFSFVKDYLVKPLTMTQVERLVSQQIDAQAS